MPVDLRQHACALTGSHTDPFQSDPIAMLAEALSPVITLFVLHQLSEVLEYTVSLCRTLHARLKVMLCAEAVRSKQPGASLLFPLSGWCLAAQEPLSMHLPTPQCATLLLSTANLSG